MLLLFEMKAAVVTFAVTAILILTYAVALVGAYDSDTIQYEVGRGRQQTTLRNGRLDMYEANIEAYKSTIFEQAGACTRGNKTSWWWADHTYNYHPADPVVLGHESTVANLVSGQGLNMCEKTRVESSSDGGCSVRTPSEMSCPGDWKWKSLAISSYETFLALTNCYDAGTSGQCTKVVAPAGDIDGIPLEKSTWFLKSENCPQRPWREVHEQGGTMKSCTHEINGTMLTAPSIYVTLSMEYNETTVVEWEDDRGHNIVIINVYKQQRGSIHEGAPSDVCSDLTCSDVNGAVEPPLDLLPQEIIDATGKYVANGHQGDGLASAVRKYMLQEMNGW